MRRSILLICTVAILLSVSSAYVVSQIRVANSQMEHAILDMDAWLRLSYKLEGAQGYELGRDTIDLNLDSALAILILNRQWAFLAEDTERQLREHLVLLQKYWAAHPPYTGEQWKTLRASPEWRQAQAERMAFIEKEMKQGGFKSEAQHPKNQ